MTDAQPASTRHGRPPAPEEEQAVRDAAPRDARTAAAATTLSFAVAPGSFLAEAP